MAHKFYDGVEFHGGVLFEPGIINQNLIFNEKIICNKGIYGNILIGHKEGTEIGDGATILGNNNTASGLCAFASGNNAIASGECSIAIANYGLAKEKYSCVIGDGQLEEGDLTYEQLNSLDYDDLKSTINRMDAPKHLIANGEYSYAIGSHCITNSDYAIAIGRYNIIRSGTDSAYSFALGYNLSISQGMYNIVLGLDTKLKGSKSIVIGSKNTIEYGSNNVIVGDENHMDFNIGDNVIFGRNNNLSGYASLFVGSNNSSASNHNYIFGSNNEVLECAPYTFTFGQSNTITVKDGNASTNLDSVHSCSIMGLGLTITGATSKLGRRGCMVVGRYNKMDTNTDALFIVGKGTSATDKSNAFRVGTNGSCYSGGNWNSNSADYAEYFEWQDANQNNEDRRGYFVTLIDDKIKIANPGDYILGIISAAPSVSGNNPEDWAGRYIKDEFGSYITEEYTYIDKITGKTITSTRNKQNPDYDASRPYIERDRRKEWSAVGMVGILPIRDDGTCKVNGYCTVADGGIATAAENGYRVIARVSDSVVKVIFK